MASVFDVANYFILKSYDDQDSEVDITKLKLQKLCYYAQGVHLAKTNNKLFKDDILAWEHGPVVKTIWEKYKSININILPQPTCISLKEIEGNFDKSELDTVTDVYSYFGQFSAWKLRNMTHEESPWINTPTNSIIDPEVILNYFKENIIA